MSRNIHAYFDQALRGNSSWWTWLAGFWLAIVVWVFASALLGIPMFGFMMLADSEAMMAMFEQMQAGAAPSSALVSALTAASYALPVFVIILYLMRAQFSSGLRKIAMALAGLMALISFAGIVVQMANQPDGANEMLAAFIPKSAGVYAFMLLTFPPLVFGLWLALKVIHKRGFKTMMTAHTHFRWKRVFQSMAVFWVIAGALTVLAHVMGFNTVEGVFDGSKFFLYAAISLCLIPLQSAAEEIMLRGYMNQGLGKYIRNPWIVFFITSAMFASLHLGNPEAAEGAANGKLLITMSGYFMFGMFACVLTYIDGGLESAIGVHAANNLYASVLLGYDNSALPTPTVFKTGLNADTDLIFTMLTLALVCLVLWKFKKPLIVDTSGDAGGDTETVFN